MDKKIVVLDNVDIVTYSAAVNEIARKFFDEELSIKMKEMVEKRFPIVQQDEYLP